MITIVDYDPGWPERFESLRREYARALAAAAVSVVAIEHVRGNAALRDEYAAVKKRVGATAANIDDYGRGKNATVQRILAAAGISDQERAMINANDVPSHEELPR